MEPLGYAQLILRRWYLIVGLALAAALLVYAISPARIVEEYSATHVVLVEGDSDAGAEANPEVVALWAKEAEVLSRAAASIGPAVDPQALGRDIEVDSERDVGTVSVTATDISATRAALKATAVAEATVAFLAERATLVHEQEQAELDAQEASLRERVAALDAAIANNPPDIETQTAERDALIRQLGPVLEAQRADAAVVRFTTIEEPERGAPLDRLPGTRTRAQRMAVAALVGAVLGFGLALLLDRADTRVRTRRAAEEHFGLPVIAEIVRIPFWSRRHRRLAVQRQPDTAVAESYRMLRSALMLLDHGTARARREATERHEAPSPSPSTDVIMITSPGRDEGKSTTAANLAAAYGEAGITTLVVSFDLRRARRRRARHGHAGVSEYLAARTPTALSSLAFDTGVPNVRAVGVGNAARPPGGQLDAQQRLLDEARTMADVVIVDTSPLLASSINRELATMVDSVVAVCRVGRTTIAEAELCGDLLAQLGAPAIGVVMVGVSAPEGSEYFSYFSVRRDQRTTNPPEPGTPSDVEVPSDVDEPAYRNGDTPHPAPAPSGEAPRVDG